MKIRRDEQEWELTAIEVREAFEELRKEYLKEDAINQLCFHALNGDADGEDEDAIDVFKQQYGVDFSELLNKESEFYMVDKIMDKFEKYSSCNEAENVTYETIIEELLRNLRKTLGEN